MKTFTLDDKEIVLRQGDVAYFTAPAIPGYEWARHKVPPGLEVEEVDSIDVHPDSIGGETLQRLRLTAVSEGEGELELAYMRPFDAEPTRRHRVTVRIEP